MEAGLMKNHNISRSWIALLIHDSIRTILSVTFCLLPFCPRTVCLFFYVSICLSILICAYLSCLSAYPTLSLSVCLPTLLCVYLSVCLHQCDLFLTFIIKLYMNIH